MSSDLSRKMREFYSSSTAYRDHLAGKSGAHYRNFLALVSRMVPRSARVLELGAGTGQVARTLSQQGYHVTATDLSALFLGAARHTASPDQGEPAFVAADVVSLPFRDDAFDAVIAGELLEHLADVAGALDEMARVVKKGGRIVLRSPALSSPIWPMIDLPRLLLGKGGRPPHYETLPQATRFFLSNVGRCVRIARRNSPVFERRTPELALEVEGGDRDAAYWSSPIEIARYLSERGFRVIQKVETSRPKLITHLLSRVAPFLSPTIAIVAEKQDPQQDRRQ